MTELNIIPECYVDTKVAEILGQASKKYIHQHGSGDVANRLIKSKDKICIAIIDEDRNKGIKAKYLSEFTIIIKEENNLILKKHKNLKQYLVIICPEIEKWLLNDAKAVEIDPTDQKYKLPPALKGFSDRCKTRDIDSDEGFYRFIKTLINKKAPSITTLKKWIDLYKKDELDSL